MSTTNDPRGPMRKVLRVDNSGSSETLVYFECGHIGHFNPIYDYTLDPAQRCFQCGPRGGQ